MRDEINSLSTHDAEIRPETMKLNNGTEWGGRQAMPAAFF